MYKYRRHPIVIPVGVFRSLWAALLPFLFTLRKDKIASLKDLLFRLAIIVGILLLLSVIEFLKWRTFTYEWDEREIRTSSGIWSKTKTLIPRSAITGFERTDNPIMKAFGLVTLKFEMAGGGKETDVVLSYIPEELALEWGDEKRTVKTDYHFSFRQLLLYGSGSPATWVTISAILALGNDFWGSEGFSIIQGWFGNKAIWFWLVGVLFGFLLLWSVASLFVASRYFGFTLELKDRVFIISRGLWKRQITRIHTEQIQGLIIAEHPFHAACGYVSVRAHLTSTQGDDGSFDNVLFPLIKRHELHNWLQYYLPEYNIHLQMTHLPPHLQLAYMWRHVLLASPSFLLILWKPWLISIALSFTIIFALFGWWRGKTAAWAFNDHHIIFTSRHFVKQTTIIPLARIQALEVAATPFGRWRKHRIVTVRVVSGWLGSTARLLYLPTTVAESILSWYINSRKSIKKARSI
ncbi:PH domain-containing protein [Microbacteriaceae bacterium 4G12]